MKNVRCKNIVRQDSKPCEGDTCFVDKQITYVPETFSLGNLTLRLFHASSDPDDETKHGHDIIYNLIHRKKDFQTTMNTKQHMIEKRNISSVFRNLEKQIYKTKKDSCIQIPKYVPAFMEIPKQDPDNIFFGTYNWYYTGGCLKRFNFRDNQHLAYVEGKSKDTLCLAPLKYDHQWCIDKFNVKNVTAAPGKEIFQVICMEKPSYTFIGVRQKTICSGYQYSEKRKISKCFNYQSHDPIASVDISSVHEELCIIDVKQGLSFWDIHTEKLPMTTYFPSDNPPYVYWHNLMYCADPSTVSIAGRKSLKWMDRRSSNVTNSFKLASLKRVLDEEEISLHFASKQNPYLIYFSTDINLYLLDIRSLESTVHCWSHLLPSPPLYNCVIPFGEGSEIVCIGNQHPGNVVLAFSSKSKTSSLVEIPSRVDSLLSLQTSGLCLDPSVKPRMSVGLTGLTYLKCKESSDIELLTQSVASDIFSQSLFSQKTEANADNFNDLVSTKEILYAFDRWNMRKLYNKLSKNDIKHNLPKVKCTGKQSWQLSKQELLEYKDVLSSLILEEWDVDRVDGNVHISGEQKVNAWLDSSFSCIYTSRGINFGEDDE